MVDLRLPSLAAVACVLAAACSGGEKKSGAVGDDGTTGTGIGGSSASHSGNAKAGGSTGGGTAAGGAQGVGGSAGGGGDALGGDGGSNMGGASSGGASSGGASSGGANSGGASNGGQAGAGGSLAPYLGPGVSGTVEAFSDIKLTLSAPLAGMAMVSAPTPDGVTFQTTTWSGSGEFVLDNVAVGEVPLIVAPTDPALLRTRNLVLVSSDGLNGVKARVAPVAALQDIATAAGVGALDGARGHALLRVVFASDKAAEGVEAQAKFDAAVLFDAQDGWGGGKAGPGGLVLLLNAEPGASQSLVLTGDVPTSEGVAHVEQDTKIVIEAGTLSVSTVLLAP